MLHVTEVEALLKMETGRDDEESLSPCGEQARWIFDKRKTRIAMPLRKSSLA
jgi:hypothetical protein